MLAFIKDYNMEGNKFLKVLNATITQIFEDKKKHLTFVKIYTQGST